MGGHDDQTGAQSASLNLLDEFKAAHTGQSEIGDNNVSEPGKGHGVLGCRYAIDVETGVFQVQLDYAAQLIFIVD
jgi:hypothetical protein